MGNLAMERLRQSRLQLKFRGRRGVAYQMQKWDFPRWR